MRLFNRLHDDRDRSREALVLTVVAKKAAGSRRDA
jgi:hypothetical protein